MKKCYNFLEVKDSKKVVYEKCPKCGHQKMCHFDYLGAHWRECTHPKCHYVGKLELWGLNCSCGKEPQKKSGNVQYIKCTNHIPPGAVLT